MSPVNRRLYQNVATVRKNLQSARQLPMSRILWSPLNYMSPRRMAARVIREFQGPPWREMSNRILPGHRSWIRRIRTASGSPIEPTRGQPIRSSFLHPPLTAKPTTGFVVDLKRAALLNRLPGRRLEVLFRCCPKGAAWQKGWFHRGKCGSSATGTSALRTSVEPP